MRACGACESGACYPRGVCCAHDLRLVAAGVPVTLHEVKELFKVFDRDNSDTVTCHELTLKLYPPPPKPDHAVRACALCFRSAHCCLAHTPAWPCVLQLPTARTRCGGSAAGTRAQ